MSSTDQTAEQKINESLSAMLDGEASDMEVRRILKSEDAELAKRWQRYQLASAAIRKEADSGFGSIDLSAAISEAIDNEPELSANTVDADVDTVKSKGKIVNLWSNIGRFAVAASVAGAVVVGVQFSPNDTATNIATAPETPVAPVSSGQPDLGVDTTVRVVGQESKPAQIILNEETKKRVQEGLEQEAQRLIREHAENAAQNTQNGVTPFVRVPDGE